MKLERRSGGDKRVVIVQHSSDRNGSAISGLMVADVLLHCGWDTHVIFRCPGPMEEVYRDKGHSTAVFEHENWLRRSHPVRFLKDFETEWRRSRKLDELLARIRPDLVYINTAVSLAAAVSARSHGIPLVWHLRELPVWEGGEMRAPRTALPLVHHVLARWPHRVVANSRAVARGLLGTRLAERAFVIPNAVSDDFFSRRGDPTVTRAKLNLPLEGPIIGVPGTLRPVKGHEFFLRSVAPLAKRRGDLHIAITGDGDATFRESLQDLSRELAIVDQLTFLGTLEDMPSFYRAVDVICVPSRSESFGRVVIEALASGVPLVATAVGGVPEIVEDAVTGDLVSYGDQDGLLRSLERLLDERDRAVKMAARGAELARQNYSEHTHRRRIKLLAQEAEG